MCGRTTIPFSLWNPPLQSDRVAKSESLCFHNSYRFSELLFEKFKVPGLMMYKDAALTCFARGRTTGMVVDMGEEFTRCCGVIDGFVSRESVSFQRFGGARLSDLYIDQCLSPFLQSQDVKTVLPRGFVLPPSHNS